MALMAAWNTYWPLVQFLLPIGLTNIAPDIADQALNRGITSMETDDKELVIDALASFGIALSLMKFFTLTLGEVRHIGLVLVHSYQDRKTGFLTALTLAGAASTILLILGFSSLGTLLIEHLHGVKHGVSEDTKSIIVLLAATPILEAFCSFHAGMLLQQRYSLVVGASSIANVTTQVLMVLVLIHTELARSTPILIPVISLYSGYHVRAAVLIVGYYIAPGIQHTIPYRVKDQPPLSVKKVLLFFWPLAFIGMVQKISRPIVNLFVARNQAPYGNSEQVLSILYIVYPVGHIFYGYISSMGAIQPAFYKSIAILTAVYPIARIFYGWLNNLSDVQTAFYKSAHGHRAYTNGERMKFTTGCIVFCLSVTLPTFFIPGSPQRMMQDLVGIEPDFAELCVIPLRLFAFMGIAVALRTHLTGWLMIRKKTKFAAPSGFFRLVAIVLGCLVFPLMGINGAPLGVAALLSGFYTETISVMIGAVYVYFRQNFALKKQPHNEIELPDAYNPRLSVEADIDIPSPMPSVNLKNGYVSTDSTDDHSNKPITSSINEPTVHVLNP